MKLIHQSGIEPFVGKDNCATFELIGKGAVEDRSGYSIAKTVVPPYETAVEHFHERTEEIYIITSGTGLVVVDGRSINVTVGDTVVIETGERHFAKSNTSAGFEFLAISIPAYDNEDFIPTNNEFTKGD